MFCPNCRTEVPSDAKYCVECGYDFTKIKTPTSKKQGQDSLDGVGTSIQQEPDIDSFRVGTLFANRYEIISEGHKGGMGAVYRCKDTKLNEVVALKVIHPRLLNSTQALSRFRQEVSISRKLQHPNIVRVYNLEEWDGKEYFTMEWVDGVTLREIIAKRKTENRTFSMEEAYHIIAQLSDALQHAHQFTIHRDIKPENILVTGYQMQDTGYTIEKAQIKLTDFGIAKMLSPSQFTSTSMRMGTPYYMAPEQKIDAGSIDKRADIYALGVVLFELLTMENTIGLEMPSEINKDLPPIIDTIIKKAVATKPNDRYADAKDLSEALKMVTDRSSEQAERSREEAEEQRKEADRQRVAADETLKTEAEKRKLAAEKERVERILDEQGRREEEERRSKELESAKKKKSPALMIGAAIVVIIGIFIFIQQNRTAETPAPAETSRPAESTSPAPAAKADSYNVTTWIESGNSMFDAHRFNEAIEAYQKVLNVDPKNTNVRIDMATCYRNINRPDMAIKEFQKALEINPNSPLAHRNLGVALAYDLKDNVQAKKEFEKYLELAPNAPDANSVRQEIQKIEAAR